MTKNEALRIVGKAETIRERLTDLLTRTAELHDLSKDVAGGDLDAVRELTRAICTAAAVADRIARNTPIK